MCVVRLSQLFLRIGTALMPPIGAFNIVRERLKWDACFAKSTVVDIRLIPTARIAVVGAFCGGAVGDERLECREAAYYHSWTRLLAVAILLQFDSGIK
jgi:hypothetical protein